MSMSKQDLELLVKAFAQLKDKAKEKDNNSYLLVVPRYSEDERGVEDHKRIDSMVVVHDWYYGSGNFLLYQGGSLEGSFDYGAVEAIYKAHTAERPANVKGDPK